MSKHLTVIGKQLVIDYFPKQALAVHVGATIQKIDHGFVQLKFPRHPILVQQHNTFHGGILSYIADTCAGMANYSILTDLTHSLTTVELKINFLKPATGNYIIGRGKILSQGGSLVVATAQLFNDQNTLVAYSIQTNKKLKPRPKHQDK